MGALLWLSGRGQRLLPAVLLAAAAQFLVSYYYLQAKGYFYHLLPAVAFAAFAASAAFAGIPDIKTRSTGFAPRQDAAGLHDGRCAVPDMEAANLFLHRAFRGCHRPPQARSPVGVHCLDQCVPALPDGGEARSRLGFAISRCSGSALPKSIAASLSTYYTLTRLLEHAPRRRDAGE